MSQAGRIVFAELGYVVGGPLGFAVGSILGALLFPKQRQYGPEQIANLQLQTTARGTPLQLHYGKQRLAGNVVWHGGFKQTRTGGGKGGKGGGGGKGQQQQESVTYSVNIAVAIEEGEPPIDRIHRIWSNKDLVDLSQFASQITVYKGTSRQSIDATINSAQQGIGSIQPVVEESIVINGTGPTYRLRFPPIVATSETIYYWSSAGSLLRSRITLTRVAASPVQDQYTIDDSTGLVTFGGTYSNVTVFFSYKFNGSGVSDAVGYRNVVYVVFKDWPLGTSTTVPNFTFEVSRRHQVIEGDSIGVWTSSSTMERRNVETGALIETLTISPGNSMLSNGWQWMATNAAGALQVHDAETGLSVFNGTVELLGNQVYSVKPSGLVSGDGEGVMGATQKLIVHSWVYNPDYTLKSVVTDWISPDDEFVFPDSGGGVRCADLDEFYVYANAVVPTIFLSGRALHVYNRKAGPDKKGERLKIYQMNRDGIHAGPNTDSTWSTLDMKVEGSLLYVYWTDGTLGEIRIYDMSGKSITSSTRNSGLLFDPQGVLITGGVANLGASEWPLVQTITGVGFTAGTNFGRRLAVCGPVIIVNHGTIVKAYRISDGVQLWTATQANDLPVVYQTKGAKTTPSTGDVNAAWVAYDMLTHTRYGSNLAKSKIVLKTFADASIEFSKNRLFLSPVFRNRKRIPEQLEQMLLLVDTFLVFSEGQFKLKARRPETGTLKQITTAAYTSGDDIIVSRQGSADLINRVLVHYTDRANDYTPSEEPATDDWLIDRKEGHEMEIGGEAITNPLHARQLAHRILWTHSFKRITAQIPIGPQDGEMEPGDVFEWTDTDYGFTKKKMRVTAIGEEKTGKAVMEVVEENDPLLDWYDYPKSEFAFLVLPQPIGPAAHTHLDLFEPPPVPANGNPSIFGIVSSPDPNWAGARIYASNDNATYTRVGEVRAPSLYGFTNTSLAATASQFEDTINTVDVTLLSPNVTLVSLTDAQWRQGINKIMIGSEIIYFKTATLVSGQRYTLSNLLRGMELTTAAAHVSGEGVLVLNQYLAVFTPVRGTTPRFGLQPVQSMSVDWSLVGRTIFFKATSISIQGIEQSLADVQPVSFTYNAKAGMPTRVNNLRPRQRTSPGADSSDDFTRSDNDSLGTGWFEAERPNSLAFRISTNRMEQRTGAWNAFAGRKGVLLSFKNQFSRGVFDTSTGAPRGGPAVRASGTFNNGNILFTGYWLELNNSQAFLHKMVKGNLDSQQPIVLGSVSLTLAGGDSVELEVKEEVPGTATLRIKKNGAVLFTVIDTQPITEADAVLVAPNPADPVFGPAVGMASRGNAGIGNDIFWRDWVGGSAGGIEYTLGTGVIAVSVRQQITEGNLRPQRGIDIEIVWGYTDVSVQEDSELERGVVDGHDPLFKNYRVKVYKNFVTLARTEDNIQAESYLYTEEMNKADNGGLNLDLKFEVSVIDINGGASEVVSSGNISLKILP